MNYKVGIREYLIILSLPEDINSDVKKFKRSLYNQFGDARYLTSRAHVSLNNFYIESTPEKAIQNELQQLLVNWRSFYISILGFGKFLSSRTIYLNITNTEILELQNHLRTVLRQRLKIAKKYTQPISKPHITIASDVSDFKFDNCWDYFKNKPYNNQFCANKITVLRKNHSIKEMQFQIAFEIQLKL